MKTKNDIETWLMRTGWPFKIKKVMNNYYQLYTPGPIESSQKIVAEGTISNIELYLNGFSAGITYADSKF